MIKEERLNKFYYAYLASATVMAVIFLLLFISVLSTLSEYSQNLEFNHLIPLTVAALIIIPFFHPESFVRRHRLAVVISCIFSALFLSPHVIMIFNISQGVSGDDTGRALLVISLISVVFTVPWIITMVRGLIHILHKQKENKPVESTP